MTQQDSKRINIGSYAIEYIASQTVGKSPDEIVAFYVQSLIFKNVGFLDYLAEEYDLPTTDILQLDKRIQELAQELQQERKEVN